ncbi:NADP oxidoreductase [Caulobacter zeae]|uniref:NADP oxidoreductase n=1 Tax=Caulobacter zeae TaxID=2055137 RepID=A0A2N5DK98_9CAUL|nr:NAD(P)-binding domain-containing protein [Caulobacter zeae]PLR26498.1 NADP oxidoreductase [Caulobacter zeae]
MRIGILGTGHIGATLVKRFSAGGHDVKVANSRGPHTIEAGLLASGARAVTKEEAVRDVEVIILSIPLNRIPDIAPLIATVPQDTVIIDTSNYYPARDGKIEPIEAGQVESLWVVDQIGHPVVKAWNAIGAASFANKAKPAGAPGRIAIPVAADRDGDRRVAMSLVEDSGLDAVDAGSLAESWRQQPGSPVYCTDLSRDEVPPALAAAEKARLPARRDLVLAVVMERAGDDMTNLEPEFLPRLNRAIFQ